MKKTGSVDIWRGEWRVRLEAVCNNAAQTALIRFVGVDNAKKYRVTVKLEPVWTAEEIEDAKKRGDEMFELFGQKEPVHDCFSCGFNGSTLTRNEPPLHLLAKCPNVDPRIREEAAERLAKKTP